MQVCIAIMHGNPVMLELREGVPYINDEPQPIKHLTEDDLVAFHEAVSAIPDDGDPGNVALSTPSAPRSSWTCWAMPWATNASPT